MILEDRGRETDFCETKPDASKSLPPGQLRSRVSWPQINSQIEQLRSRKVTLISKANSMDAVLKAHECIL